MTGLRIGQANDGVAPGAPAVAIAAAYIVPPTVAGILVWFLTVSGSGPCETAGATLALGGFILFVGLAAGALAGRAASAAERRAVTQEYERRLDDLDHDLRSPMTIIRGEVELVLNQEDIPAAERARSGTAVVEQIERLERRLRQEYRK